MGKRQLMTCVTRVLSMISGTAVLSGVEATALRGSSLERRDDSPTDVCGRWSHQTAVVDDTIYIYGGQAKSSTTQKDNRWNNNFITLSLSNDWDTTSPELSGLPQPNGPPAVANGYLWHDGEHIYQYGGLFSDTPPKEPGPFALWQYDIKGKKWSDITDQTSVSGSSGTKEIQRAAEGAGANIAGRGLGFYFGGHLDGYTTQGWDDGVPRVYLKSLLQFDMDKKEFTNITESGLEKAGVPERADGVLVFVPWGKEGILIAIGGGTNETFSQMNIIDVYDLASKKWTRQATAGASPKYRVNPCAVVASAADGSSHNVYFFGGQNLVPYMQQKQYDDFYILTIPSFTWVKVDQSKQSVPPPRAGHTCDIVGSQMVVIGGYVGEELSCDSPGFYVFDVSELQWVTKYSAAAGGFGKDTGNLEKTGGLVVGGTYKVPQVVVDIVGGNSEGGATVTKPARNGDPDSPIVTAKADDYKYITYPTVAVTTDKDGRVTTSTISPKSKDDGKKPNIGAIVGGVVGGIVFLAAIVFAGLYILYRRKIKELRASAARVNGANGYGAPDKGVAELPADEPGQGNTINGRKATDSSADLDALEGEPTFWGVLLSPRRSLRVVNH